jgi:hypothetical protein
MGFLRARRRVKTAFSSEQGDVAAESVESALLALNQALAEGEGRVREGRFGAPLRDMLRHARSMLELIETRVDASAPNSQDAQLRTLLKQMRERLMAIEATLGPDL